MNLWGVANASDMVLDLWKPSGMQEEAKHKDTDSYAMYIKIMKSVAEIMNEA